MNEWKPCITKIEKEELLSYGKTIVENIINSNSVSINTIHGSKSSTLENIIYTLVERNVNYSDKEFDNVFHPLVDYLSRNEEILMQKMYPTDNFEFDFVSDFSYYIIFCLLITAGYREEVLIKFYTTRLNTISSFCIKMDFDIFRKENECKGIPKSFSSYKVLKQEIAGCCNYKIPLLYDVYLFKTMYKESSQDDKLKIENVIKYICSDEYQKFPDGYGLVQTGNKHYFKVGWDIKFPIQTEVLNATNFHCVELLSCFENARNQTWYKNNISLIKSYQTSNGEYNLPHSILPQKEGYWINGDRKYLGENRHSKEGFIQNGTYRVKSIEIK